LKKSIDETASEIDMATVQYLVPNCRHIKGVYEELYIIEVRKSRRMRWGEDYNTHGERYCPEEFDGKREKKSNLGDSVVDVRII
jgi:hypothetical protein